MCHYKNKCMRMSQGLTASKAALPHINLNIIKFNYIPIYKLLTHNNKSLIKKIYSVNI